MRVLGLSAFTRDSAAALVVDGVPVAASSEERFTRKKGDEVFPQRAIRAVLRLAELEPRELDRVVFFEKPLRKFERVLSSQLAAFPRSSKSFAAHLFTWLGDRLWLKNRIAADVGVDEDKVVFVEHHRAHAAWAFRASPFESAAVLVVDAVGEWATTSLWRARGEALECLAESHFPASLGLFAAAITQHLGFEPFADEAKVAELATFGAPRFEKELDLLARPSGDGTVDPDPRYFRFAFDLERLSSPHLEERLGPARRPGGPLRFLGEDRRDADLAASLQALLERVVLENVHKLCALAGEADLCFAGALAQNPWLVARISEGGGFARVFVPPASGESGAALGAALVASEAPRASWSLQNAFLGDGLGIHERPGEHFERGRLVEALLAGKLVGVAQGASEWGARALGGRNLYADARSGAALERLAREIKRRESFRGFALAILAERAGDWLELDPSSSLCARWLSTVVIAKPALCELAPSVVRPDGRVRAHLVDAQGSSGLHALLTAFAARSGIPLLVSTSLNQRGDPLTRTATDAFALFDRTSLDLLVVGEELYSR